MNQADRWAIVLAAGQGTRLGSITTGTSGTVPKQFCSLRGGRSLLELALARAERVVERTRIVVVVAAEHQPYWCDQLAGLPAENIVVQPRNRGTVAGLLLPLFHVLRRAHDPAVVVFPSDHYVEDEDVLARSLQAAFAGIERGEAELVLLGMAPRAANPDYGWIVPGAGNGPIQRVRAFVEKPDPEAAYGLMHEGAIWNTLVLCARGRVLQRCIERCVPGVGEPMAEALTLGGDALVRCYDTLPVADLSRDVLQRVPEHLRVLAVPPCGWTDLGTKARVAECLATTAAASDRQRAGRARLNLQRQLARDAVPAAR